MDFMSEELSELYDRRRELAERISNYFHGSEVFEGDRGYQDLQEQLSNVEEQINEFNND
jgi:hypothetical protein